MKEYKLYEGRNSPLSIRNEGDVDLKIGESRKSFSMSRTFNITPKNFGPSKGDPELQREDRDVKYKFPFALSTDHERPIESRFLMSLRT